jgi:transposase
MILIGADVHKRSHTLVALSAATGEVRGEITIPASPAGFADLEAWAVELGAARVWAIEDCRHVSGALERHLHERGERVLRLAPGLAAGARRRGRTRGKSDPIDAQAIARAALAEGIDRLPVAHVDHEADEIRVLIDHHDRLVGMRTQAANRLRWDLHELCPDMDIPAGGLDRVIWQERISRRLSRTPQGARVRVARDELALIRRTSRQIADLARELAILVEAYAPGLMAERGIGPLIGARLVGEIQGIGRIRSEAALARLGGVAPIPASSGERERHRLDRGGNRRLNCALHRLALSRARTCPDSRAYMERRRAEGLTYREALRCLKRYMARRVYRLLVEAEQRRLATAEPALAEPALT